MRDVRIGLVGCGAAAHAHARAISATHGARCTVVFDVDSSRADAFCRARCSSAVRAVTLDDVAAHADAAIVAVPNAEHAAATIALLSKGVHVLCEKPLAVSAADAERMIRAAHIAGRALHCGLVRRFFGSTELVTHVLSRRLLGAPLRFEMRESVINWPMRKGTFLRGVSGGGVFIDMAPHLLDLLAVWFGRVEIVDYADDQRGGVEANAVAEVFCHYGNEPIVGRIHLSRSYRMTNRTRIFCAGGHFDVDPHQRDRITLAFNGGVPLVATAEVPTGDPFATQLNAFLTAVRSNPLGRASAEDALTTVALVQRCYERRRDLPEPWTVEPPRLDNRLARFGRILVTGATGAVGSRMVERWAEAGRLEQLRCMVRSYGRAARIQRFPVEVVEADLLNRSSLDGAVRGCDAIVHLAAGEQAGAETRALVDTAIKHGIRRFVHMSTAAVYGRGLPETIESLQEETAVIRTGEPYADQKAAAERAVLQGRGRRLDVHVLRPHMVYGPGLRWSGELMELLAVGEVPIVEDGGWCNLVHIDDLVDAVASALVSDRGFGGPLFITDGTPRRWSEYIAAHAALLGLEPFRLLRTDVLPPPLSWGAWLRDSMRPLLPVVRSREFRQFLVESPFMQRTAVRAYFALRKGRLLGPSLSRLRGEGPAARPARFDPTWSHLQLSQARLSVERAAHTIGFRARIDFSEGLRRTARWFEAVGLLPESSEGTPKTSGLVQA